MAALDKKDSSSANAEPHTVMDNLIAKIDEAVKSRHFKKCTDAQKAFTVAALKQMDLNSEWVDTDDTEWPDSDVTPPPRRRTCPDIALPAPNRVAMDANHTDARHMDASHSCTTVVDRPTHD